MRQEGGTVPHFVCYLSLLCDSIWSHHTSGSKRPEDSCKTISYGCDLGNLPRRAVHRTGVWACHVMSLHAAARSKPNEPTEQTFAKHNFGEACAFSWVMPRSCCARCPVGCRLLHCQDNSLGHAGDHLHARIRVASLSWVLPDRPSPGSHLLVVAACHPARVWTQTERGVPLRGQLQMHKSLMHCGA
jgi:hypothetical protein